VRSVRNLNARPQQPAEAALKRWIDAVGEACEGAKPGSALRVGRRASGVAT